ncbi:SDR family NAD(P)-dependent oxidoreductase [Georgenia sp. MJ170]|uniref:SDR family NAD(P)-dependent oxidoreductase n=1 Tax=Georgenia sunbinii TaxID=3117728 RepID=UPI002F261CF0
MSATEPKPHRPFAVITGASSGIGREIADVLAEEGYDLLVCAEDDAIVNVLPAVPEADVQAVQADLSTYDGVADLVEAVGERDVDVLVLNAGIAVGGDFVTTALDDDLELIGVNVTAVVHLAKRLLPRMVAAGRGRLLFTGSVTSMLPGPYYATYSASKAFVLNFAESIRYELRDSGVTVTTMMPGPTDTEFFDRAGMEDTRVGQSDSKDDPADVARDGVAAMLAGKDNAVVGSTVKNTLMSRASKALPERAKAAFQARLTEPQDERD